MRTIEEKAKAYDEAIKRIENIKTSKCEITFIFTEDLFEHIFPELAESEDERIRKAIGYAIGQSTHSDGTLINGVSSEEALTWLEKQGEQKPADKKGMNLVEEEMTPFQREVFCIIDTTIEKELGLKQVCDKLFALASNEIKQKFSWSEEDEQITLSIEQVMNCASLLNIVPDKINKIRTWLKSLKEKVQPQPQWSKMDDVRLTSTIEVLEFAHSLDSYNQYGKEDIKNNLSWLKSLKERYTWKPSDEQMKALDFYIKTYVDTEGCYGSEVLELYEQLKKLREK